MSQIYLPYLIWALIYVIVILLLIRLVNKLSKDAKTILWTLTTNLNDYFMIINSTIAKQRNNLERFDDLIDVLYAKKKWFLWNTSHWVSEQYELYLSLKDGIEYLSDYISSDLTSNELNKQTEWYFAFLFSMKTRQKITRSTLLLLTLGLWSGFIQDAAPL